METAKAARPPVYTPETAARALPLIRAIAQDSHATYLRLRERLSEFNDFHSLEELSSDLRLPQNVRDDLLELRDHVIEMASLGARFGEPELGVVFLEGRLGGRRVQFCWKLGEPAIRYWIPLDGGYDERRPLGARHVSE